MSRTFVGTGMLCAPTSEKSLFRNICSWWHLRASDKEFIRVQHHSNNNGYRRRGGQMDGLTSVTEKRSIPRVDRTVARLAIRFMTVERRDIDEAVETAVRDLGESLRALGGAAVILDATHGSIERSYEWCALPWDRPATCRRGIQLYCLPWFRERFMHGERIEIRRLSDLPEEAAAERRALGRRGIGALLLVPILVASRPVGFLAFAGTERFTWSEGEMNFTELAAELIGRVFERCELEELNQHRVQELERTSAELEEFAHQAAHDLKAPLTAITGYLDLLRRHHSDELGEGAAELVDRADRAAGRLHGLIDTLLTYSTLGTEPLRPIKTDCEALLEVTCEDLTALMRERGASIVADPLPTVTADLVQLRRVFQNLLTNAIKFAGPTPRVRVSAAECADGYVFAVSDDGPGINPKDHKRIFEPFERLRSDENQPGSGIGLAICSKIVKLHGGRIWVESTPGAGAMFCFTLPREASA